MADIQTPRDVIEALGGSRAVAQLMALRVSAVSNWRNFEKLPAHSFPTLSAALTAKGVAAPMSLWNWDAPKVPPRSKKSEAARKGPQDECGSPACEAGATPVLRSKFLGGVVQ